VTDAEWTHRAGTRRIRHRPDRVLDRRAAAAGGVESRGVRGGRPRLISGYALSVAVGAIVLTAATARLHRKHVLVGLVALFVIGNLLSAVAPNHEVMLLGRIDIR
jgi:MFS family permease